MRCSQYMKLLHMHMQALQVLYSETEVGGEVGLPCHWMRDFFLASLCLEVQENEEALSRLQVPLWLSSYMLT